MAKQPKKESRALEVIKKEADDRLHEIASHMANIKQLQSECEAEIEKILIQYAAKIKPLEIVFESGNKCLIQLMRMENYILFAGTDVVNLPHGSLIHNKADKVTIPRDALEACKTNKFNDVIKIVESLDRDAIEKWPDAKLALIGAERKPKEEFKYTLKGETK